MENVDEMGSGNISSNIQDDSFIVDIQQQITSLHSEKDVNPNSNSRITLQKCLSRKGMQRGGAEKNSGYTHTPVASPRATLHGASMPEKPMVVMVGATDQSNPQLHNSITIMTGGGGGAVATESMVGTFRKFSFRRPLSWIVNPRRILFFFATISSMGTILLIYFTLSINKLNGDA